MIFKREALLSGLILTASLVVADTKMVLSELPATVQTAVKQQLQGGQVIGASSEKENGRTTYEVQTMLDGKSRDLSFDDSGKLLEVEQEVNINRIPNAAKAALERRSAGGTIRKVESVTAGNSISYEASVTTKAGQHTEIVVKPDGTPNR